MMNQFSGLDYAGNIRRVYDMANREDYGKGVRWYEEAQAFASDIAVQFGFSLETAAGILAVLSPGVRWSQQLRSTAAFVQAVLDSPDETNPKAYPGSFLGANKEKARQIVNGADPDEIVSGVKVRAFYANILGMEGLTIDRWALRIAVGDLALSPDECAALLRPSSRVRKSVVVAYIDVADDVGIPAHHLQAITWVVARRLSGFTD
jgi:hypothetical protein